ncbi:hypothetical protein, partial [Chitinimonas taiwanensis]|uniref:hypothetical protein n=1 Tax=Chitinimonas taiwanensis TaxID=240412 RepID=UPI0035ADB821
GGITVACPGTITVKASKKSFVGAASLDASLPEFPVAPFEFKPFKLDLRLQDIPGPGGLPMAHIPWEIVLMRNGTTFDRVVCKGETDEDGRICLGPAEEKTFAELYAQQPNDLWLDTPGDSRPIKIVFESDAWSAQKKGAQALAALDFADRGAAYVDTQQASTRLATMDYGKHPSSLWAEIKKK